MIQNDVTHINVFVQEGAAAAVRDGSDWIARMMEDDRRKRDLMVQWLNRLPGVQCREPEGTIYAFPDIRGAGISSAELARRILRVTHVVTEAGSFAGE